MKICKFFPVTFLLLLSSCYSTKHAYLPIPKDLPTFVKGAYITLKNVKGEITIYQNDDQAKILNLDINDSYKIIEGELLAVEKDTIYVLKTSNYESAKIRDKIILKMNRENIDSGVIRISKAYNSPGWAALFPLVSIGHGGWGIFTLPINIATAIDLGTATNKVIFDESSSWNHLHKFSRYPQGIPKGVKINHIE